VLVNEQNQTIIKLKAELQEAKDDKNRELLEEYKEQMDN